MSAISSEEIELQLQQLPPEKLTVVYEFVRFLLHQEAAHRLTEARQTMVASEAVLSRDWLSPEEDEAWAHLGIVCQITSQAKADSYSVGITDTDFTQGGLRQDSNVRPNRIFTADSNIVAYRAGALSSEKVQEVLEVILRILS